MNWMLRVVREIAGLFVDDGAFALAIAVWLGLAWWSRGVAGLHAWSGVVLFAGLAVILVVSVVRFAKGTSR